jgi:hypothetical protein
VQPSFAYHESVWPKLATTASSTSTCRVGAELSINMDFTENATRLHVTAANNTEHTGCSDGCETRSDCEEQTEECTEENI